VNAIEFAADGASMSVALFTAEVARNRGVAPAAGAPELALYESRRAGDGWTDPQLLPFSGRFKDYEGTLSPDGATMIFNSWRPLPDGRVVTNQKNNLWMVRRAGSGWSQPIYLAAINRLEHEESYAAIGPNGRVIYVREGARDEHGEDYDLHETRLTSDGVEPSTPFAPAASRDGESDPWHARDGSYVIFTRWDRARTWEEDVDLYITFDRGGRWTTPVPLSLNDPAGPDYALSIAGSPEMVYWKRRGGTHRAPWAPILADAQGRAESP
jgi:hypothetical protein